jgi:hypothetical protein
MFNKFIFPVAVLSLALTLPVYADTRYQLTDEVGMDTNGLYVSGKFTNSTGNTFGTTCISYKAYNKDHELIGNPQACVTGLAPGETWSFKTTSVMGGASAEVGNVLITPLN